MPWTVSDPPPPAQNWSEEERRKCVLAANAVLREGGSEQDAIFACIHAAGRGERTMDAKINDDMLISFGGAVKAVNDEGLVQGYIVRYGSRDDVDLEGEFFTPETDLGPYLEAGPVAMVHHGIPVQENYRDYARRTLKNPMKTIKDDVGIIGQHLYDMADEYEAMLFQLAKDGKFGYSTGAIPYAVEIDYDTGEIKKWIVTEVSYTPTPAEPRNRVVALKAYMSGLNGGSEPEGESATPVPAEVHREHSVSKGATDMKRFKLGASSWGVYKTNEEGQKLGDPLEVFVGDSAADHADSWIADQKKPDWQKAIEGLSTQLGEVLTASRSPGDGPLGQALTPEYAQPRKSLTWPEFVKAVVEKDTEKLYNMGSGLKTLTGVKDVTERTGAEGAYLIPTPLSTEFYRFEPEADVVWPRARVWNMSSRTQHWPALDQTGSTAGTTNFLGGFKPLWNETGTDKPEDEPTFRQIKLETNEMSVYTEVHEDVLRDSIINLTQFISQLGRDAVRFYMDEAFLDGNGVGQPLGIINAPATLTVARNTANQFNYVDATAMLELLTPGSYANAIWILNVTVLDQLLEMTDPLGAYVWQPNAREGIRGPLFGLPVVFTEKTPALGTEGDVILADCRHYYVGLSGEIYVAVSEHYQFRANKVAIKVVGFVDGQPALSQAIYLKDGTNQVSPFVMLTDAAT